MNYEKRFKRFIADLLAVIEKHMISWDKAERSIICLCWLVYTLFPFSYCIHMSMFCISDIVDNRNQKIFSKRFCKAIDIDAPSTCIIIL